LAVAWQKGPVVDGDSARGDQEGVTRAHRWVNARDRVGVAHGLMALGRKILS
jgi:hypothetical protein